MGKIGAFELRQWIVKIKELKLKSFTVDELKQHGLNYPGFPAAAKNKGLLRKLGRKFSASKSWIVRWEIVEGSSRF